jgi:hypothetical protein
MRRQAKPRLAAVLDDVHRAGVGGVTEGGGSGRGQFDGVDALGLGVMPGLS